MAIYIFKQITVSILQKGNYYFTIRCYSRSLSHGFVSFIKANKFLLNP